MKIAQILLERERLFYHGTARSDLNFRAGQVAYFTINQKDAIAHAEMAARQGGEPKTIEARLSVKNPTIIDDRQMHDLHFDPDRVREFLDQGFDCAVGPYGSGEVCVFDPAAIQVSRVIPLAQMGRAA